MSAIREPVSVNVARTSSAERAIAVSVDTGTSTLKMDVRNVPVM